MQPEQDVDEHEQEGDRANGNAKEGGHRTHRLLSSGGRDPSNDVGSSLTTNDGGITRRCPSRVRLARPLESLSRALAGFARFAVFHETPCFEGFESPRCKDCNEFRGIPSERPQPHVDRLRGNF